MTGGIPTTDSYERILSLVDSDELNNILDSINFKFEYIEELINYLKNKNS